MAGVVLLAVLGGGLAGCSEPAPVGTLPDAPTAGGSTGGQPVSPTVTPPAKPTGEPTPKSAIQFVRYFLASYNYAYSSSQTSAITSISLDACSYCRSAVRDIEALRANGERVSGFAVSLNEATSPPVEITTGTLVIATIDQEPGQATNTQGKSRDLPGVRRLQCTFGLDWTTDGWLMRGVDIEKGTGEAWLD